MQLTGVMLDDLLKRSNYILEEGLYIIIINILTFDLFFDNSAKNISSARDCDET